MAELQNIDVSLGEVVSEIEKGNFLIPKFQRDFVWKGTDIASLGDSIIRGYPISSMLTMPANGMLKISASPLKTQGAVDTGSNPHYVLDGQQRITSLAKLFLGYDDKHEYYFDMLSILCDAYPEDNIAAIPSIQDRLMKGRHNRSKGFSTISDSLCRSFSKRRGTEREALQDFRFIHGRAIVQKRFSSAVNSFLKEAFDGVSQSLLNKYVDYLGGKFGEMSKYGIPFTKISAEANLGLVVRVFEKVNTTGKKLSLFDLINAKSFESVVPQYEMGLTDFITNSLARAEDNKTYDEAAIDCFFEAKKNGKVKIYSDLAPFIRCFTISEHLARDVVPSITQDEMLSKDADDWFHAWEQKSDVMLKFISKLRKEGILSLMNKTFCEYMTAIVMAKPRLLIETVFIQEVKKYALGLSLTKGTFNKSNLNSVGEFNNLGNYLITAHESEKRSHAMISYEINKPLRPEKIAQWGPWRQQYKAILYILYSEKASGKFMIDIVGNAIKESNLASMDEHHLYPKARTKGKEADQLFRSVANIALVNASTNRYEIKDSHPFEYLNKFREEFGEEKFDLIAEQNALPNSIWESQSVRPQDALNERLTLITNIVNEYLGVESSALNTEAGENADDDQEDDDLDQGDDESYQLEENSHHESNFHRQKSISTKEVRCSIGEEESPWVSLICEKAAS